MIVSARTPVFPPSDCRKLNVCNGLTQYRINPTLFPPNDVEHVHTHVLDDEHTWQHHRAFAHSRERCRTKVSDRWGKPSSWEAGVDKKWQGRGVSSEACRPICTGSTYPHLPLPMPMRQWDNLPATWRSREGSGTICENWEKHGRRRLTLFSCARSKQIRCYIPICTKGSTRRFRWPRHNRSDPTFLAHPTTFKPVTSKGRLRKRSMHGCRQLKMATSMRSRHCSNSRGSSGQGCVCPGKISVSTCYTDHFLTSQLSSVLQTTPGMALALPPPFSSISPLENVEIVVHTTRSRPAHP